MKAEFKQCRKGNILEAHFKTTLSHDIAPLRFEATYLSLSQERSLCGLMQVGKGLCALKTCKTQPKSSVAPEGRRTRSHTKCWRNVWVTSTH